MKCMRNPREVRDFWLPYASDATIVDVRPSKNMPKVNLNFTLILRSLYNILPRKKQLKSLEYYVAV
jgi:hypothetical protein